MSADVLRPTAAPSTLKRIGVWQKQAWKAISPGPLAWQGAALGLLIMSVFFILIASYSVFLAQPRVVSFLMGSAQFIAMAAIVGALLVLLVAALKRIPVFYGWSFVCALVLLFVSFFISIMGFVSQPAWLSSCSE